MEYKEAIKWQKAFQSTYETSPESVKNNVDEAIGLAIDSMEKMPEYERLKSLNETKRPKTRHERTFTCPPDCGGEEFDEYEDVPHCPNCDATLNELGKYPFCSECGQRIDWAKS